jgi:hypothetical protein
VPDLAGGIARAGPQAAVDHRPGAEAGPDEDRDEAVTRAASARVELAPRRRPHVVLEHDRRAQRVPKRVGERHVGPAEVGRLDHDAGFGVDLAGARDAERAQAAARRGQLGDGVPERLENRGGTATRVAEDFGAGEEAAIVPDHAGANPGAAEVDADDSHGLTVGTAG